MRSLILRLVLAAPLLVLLVLFALSNPQTVSLTMWPFDLAIVAPLSLAILGAMGVAFLAGALFTWVVGLRARWRARRAEQAVAALRREVASLSERNATPASLPAGTLLPPPDRR